MSLTGIRRLTIAAIATLLIAVTAVMIGSGPGSIPQTAANDIEGYGPEQFQTDFATALTLEPDGAAQRGELVSPPAEFYDAPNDGCTSQFYTSGCGPDSAWDEFRQYMMEFYWLPVEPGVEYRIYVTPIDTRVRFYWTWVDENYDSVLTRPGDLRSPGRGEEALAQVLPPSTLELFLGDFAPGTMIPFRLRADQSIWSLGAFNIRVETAIPDAADTVRMSEPYNYPPEAEHGARLFREFRIVNEDDLLPATNGRATLKPVGECTTRSDGRLFCEIPSGDLPLGTSTVSFARAWHDDVAESVEGWPSMTVELVERETKSRLETTGSAKIEAGAGLYLSQKSDVGFALELPKDGSVLVESTRSVTYGIGLQGGLGVSAKLIVLQPSITAGLKVGVESREYHTGVLRLTDLTQPDQRQALAAYLAAGAIDTIAINDARADALIDLIGGFDLSQSYDAFLVKNEAGMALGAKAEVKGLFSILSSPKLNPYSLGVSAKGTASASLGFQTDLVTNRGTIIFRADLGFEGTFTPQPSLIFPNLIDPGDSEFLPPTIRDTGATSAVVKFEFSQPGVLDQLIFELSVDQTQTQDILKDRIIYAFDGDAIQNSPLWTTMRVLLDPTLDTQFDWLQLLGFLEASVEAVPGTMTIINTEGRGLKIPLALGARVDLLAGISLSGSLTGEWIATDRQTTQVWLIQDGQFVPAIDFPAGPTINRDGDLTDMIVSALSEAFDRVNAREALTTLGGDAFDSLNEGGTRVVLTGVPGGTIVTFLGDVMDFFSVEARTNSIGSASLATQGVRAEPNAAVAADRLRSAQFGTGFFVSDIVEVSPFDATADPALTLTIAYDEAFDSVADDLAIYRWAHGGWQPLQTMVNTDVRGVQAEIDRLGLFVVGVDSSGPSLAILQTAEGFVAGVSDDESGVDTATITVVVDGANVATSYHAALAFVATTDTLVAGQSGVLTVSDLAGNESELAFTISASTRVQSLAAGWNLVGTPATTSIIDALAAIDGTPSAIFTWNAVAQSFRSFDPSAPAFLNSLSELRAGDGVWINVPGGGRWSLAPVTEARMVPLLPGFNLVAWTGPDGASVADALEGLGDVAQAVFTWDAATQQFRSFTPGAPAFLNTATTFRHGEGVWVLASRQADWEQPAP